MGKNHRTTRAPKSAHINGRRGTGSTIQMSQREQQRSCHFQFAMSIESEYLFAEGEHQKAQSLMGELQSFYQVSPIRQKDR